MISEFNVTEFSGSINCEYTHWEIFLAVGAKYYLKLASKKDVPNI